MDSLQTATSLQNQTSPEEGDACEEDLMRYQVIYYELLLENQIIDTAKYCEQFDRLKEVRSAEASRIYQQERRDLP